METSQFTGKLSRLDSSRGMRQRRYDSVEKMLDLVDVVGRIGPRFPVDSLYLDPNDRKTHEKLISTS